MRSAPLTLLASPPSLPTPPAFLTHLGDAEHLPALYDPSTRTWTSGYGPITRHLASHAARASTTSSLTKTTTTTPTTTTKQQQADGTAYAAFLSARAAPLLALSLYASPANYAGATRPALGRPLPFPLPWTEPPALRAAHARRAAPLGRAAGLRVDTDVAVAGGEEEEEQGMEKEMAARGWVALPAALGNNQKKKGVAAMLAPEQKARIRLEALAADVLDVLAEVDWERQAVGLRCLGFAYLALMAVPDLPRPWLREVVERRYGALLGFVERFRGEVFGGAGVDADADALPWAEEDGQSRSAVAVGVRFARGVLAEVPWLGEQWCRWWAARKRRQERKRRGLETGPSGDLLLFSGIGAALMAVGASIFFYRGLPPFGAPVQIWRKPMVTLSSFGAAGAVLSGALYGL